MLKHCFELIFAYMKSKSQIYRTKKNPVAFCLILSNSQISLSW